LLLTATAAEADVDDRALLSAYAKARADSLAGAGKAADGYAAALALSPNDELLAARALNKALASGNRALAVRAANVLQAKNLLAPDARLLLLSEALRARNWKSAHVYIEAIQKDQVFSFMAPILRAWVAQDSGKGDPLALLGAPGGDDLAAAYAAEQRPLLMIARGKGKEGVDQLLAVSEAAGARATRLRIAGAATLQQKGHRAQAMRLLQGEVAPIVAARRLLESGKAIPGAISDAPSGIAEFLVRVAIDLKAQDVDALALVYARLATFLAPESSETWLVTSQLLADEEQYADALAALANIRPGDPFAPGATDNRIRLLAASGRTDEALAEALATTAKADAGSGDWARLGDVYSELKRHQDAAAAYGRALDLARSSGGAGQSEWTLWLLKGGALEQAGNWPQAKAALQEAYKLAPDQPLVLNYLGYAQLERRENVEAAMGLIAQAMKLQPDSAEITDSLGWAHYMRGNLPAAIQLLEKAVAGRPADVEINEHLGDAYYSAGRRYEARYAWRAALLHAEREDAARLLSKIETGLEPQPARR
jgi:tetratricopeptide (TPR) repeat protein